MDAPDQLLAGALEAKLIIMEKYIVKDRIVHMFDLASQHHCYYDAANPPTFLCLDSLRSTPLTIDDAEEVIRKMSGQPGQKWDIYEIDPDYVDSDEMERRAYEELNRQARRTGRIY